MTCRPGCAACCIYISISSPIPGMPEGKPAGIRCRNLDGNNLCRIYGTEHYPKVCHDFKPDLEMCGETNEHAKAFLELLEKETSPDKDHRG